MKNEIYMTDPLFLWSPENLKYYGTGFFMMSLAVLAQKKIEKSFSFSTSPIIWVSLAIVFGLLWQNSPLIMSAVSLFSFIIAVVAPLIIFWIVFEKIFAEN